MRPKRVARMLSYLAVAFAVLCSIGLFMLVGVANWSSQVTTLDEDAQRVTRVLFFWLSAFGPVTFAMALMGLFLARESSRQTMKIRLWVGVVVGAVASFVIAGTQLL